MALAGELGYRIGIKSRIEEDQNRKEQINTMGSGLFILLSLLSIPTPLPGTRDYR
jgi:hypothetical protein